MQGGVSGIRSVRMSNLRAEATLREDGSTLIRPLGVLGDYPRSIVDALESWAGKTPDATLIGERQGEGWRKLSFAEVLQQIQALAGALLDAGLSPERPLIILSGNEIEHFLLGLAAIWVGIPYAPISPAYSLVSADFAKLRHVAELLTPGMIYASDGAAYAPAIDAVFGAETPLIVRTNPPRGRQALRFDDLLTRPTPPSVAAAHAAIGPDTVAKILFTSGSTGLPKGVITTNRMMSCNQEMIRTVLSFLQEEPPVLLDWMPWSHVAGGSHNTGIAIYNGGSFFIDDGQPTAPRFGRTLENLLLVQPTFFTNVPKAYELLVSAFETHPEVRRSLFSRLKLLQYAGAGLSQHVFQGLDQAAQAETGERVMIITGYGATETAPFAFTTTWPVAEAGHVGLPAPGMLAKLVPNGDKRELRVTGPNVTPGYWRDPAKTAEAFDEEGFYRIGDAVRLADAGDLSKGLIFDGRLTEDFKLSTGTWVNFAAVRAGVIAACAPLVRDVVLTGLDQNFIGALIFPDLEACARYAGLPVNSPAATVVGHPAVRQKFADSLAALAQRSTGSSTLVARALVLASLPDLDKGEVTDKGSINQRAVRSSRADLVEALHARTPGPDVLVQTKKSVFA